MWRRAVVLLVGCFAACSFAWDDFYPRPDNGGAGTGGDGGSSTSAGGTAGTMAEGGSGGSAGGAGGAGGSGGGGGAMPIMFYDSFDRPNSVDIGNDWVEKTPGAFDLTAGLVLPNMNGGNGYLNNLVFRPAAEALLDLEASVEFALTSPNGVPQIFARVEHATILNVSAYTGYNLWFTNNNTAFIGRQVGTTVPSATLATITVSPTINTGATYRMRLRVQGTDPVLLEGFVEQFDGMSWNVIGTAGVADSAPERISIAGAMGFACHNNTAFYYENFRYQGL